MALQELVTARELAARREGACCILDVRAEEEQIELPDGTHRSRRCPARAAYEAGHIPGAVFVPVDEVLEDDGVASRLPEPGRLQALFRRLGVGQTRPVVVYDQTGATLATRVWWTLRALGHPDVAVLDGGLDAWIAEGYPLSQEEPHPPAGDWEARLQPGWLAHRQEVLRAVREGSTLLVDTRSPDQFEAGHIPGAVNVPAAALREPGGRGFLPPERLRQLLAARGLPPDPDRPVITYCRTGVSATAAAFHLRRLGWSRVAVYVGSWNEWSRFADEAR